MKEQIYLFSIKLVQGSAACLLQWLSVDDKQPSFLILKDDLGHHGSRVEQDACACETAVVLIDVHRITG